MAKKKKATEEFFNTWVHHEKPCGEIPLGENIRCSLFNDKDSERLTRTVLIEKTEKNNWKINIMDYVDTQFVKNTFTNAMMMSYIFKHMNLNDIMSDTNDIHLKQE